MRKRLKISNRRKNQHHHRTQRTMPSSSILSCLSLSVASSPFPRSEGFPGAKAHFSSYPKSFQTNKGPGEIPSLYVPKPLTRIFYARYDKLEWRQESLGKQVTVREVLQRLRKEGFIPAPTHRGHGSHQRYVHKDDPTRYADISYHSSDQVIPKGTLRNIERTARI